MLSEIHRLSISLLVEITIVNSSHHIRFILTDKAKRELFLSSAILKRIDKIVQTMKNQQ